MQIVNSTKFRRCIVKKLNKIIKNNKVSTNLEIGIYNFSVRTAKERNIVRKWNNRYLKRKQEYFFLS